MTRNKLQQFYFRTEDTIDLQLNCVCAPNKLLQQYRFCFTPLQKFDQLLYAFIVRDYYVLETAILGT